MLLLSVCGTIGSVVHANEQSPRGPPSERRILIVDDHPIVRRGLAALIDGEPDLVVCAEAATQQAGLQAIDSSRPDLVIADISLVEGDGIATLRDIRSRDADLPVLVLTMHDSRIYAERAFRAGATGYITKREMNESLLDAIRCVLGGDTYVSPKVGIEADTT